MKKRWMVLLVIISLMMLPWIARHLGSEPEAPQGREVRATDENADTDTDKTKKHKKNLPKNAIGRIKIRAIDIDYPIYEGTDESSLSFGIGHMTGTAGLLEEGNCVLCGHNGSRRGLFFTRLSQIDKKDEVIIEGKDGEKRTYSVVATNVIGPYDTKVIKATKKEILTLITCAYHGTRRFVVKCEPIQSTTDKTHSGIWQEYYITEAP